MEKIPEREGFKQPDDINREKLPADNEKIPSSKDIIMDNGEKGLESEDFIKISKFLIESDMWLRLTS